MKKIIKIISIFVLLFALYSCNKKKNIDDKLKEKYTVTFHFQDDSGVEKTEKTEYNKDDVIERPNEKYIGAKKGYNIKSWKFNGDDFTFGVKITQNIDLYATYEIKTFKVKTEVNGEVINHRDHQYGEKLSISNPSFENYNFLGWYIKGTNERYDVTKAVEEDLFLVAKLELKKFRIRLVYARDITNNPLYYDINVAYGKKLTLEDLTLPKGLPYLDEGGVYTIGSVYPLDKRKRITSYKNIETNNVFDITENGIYQNMTLEPIFEDDVLVYEVFLPDGSKKTFTAEYDTNIKYKGKNYPEYENKAFDGVYTSDNKLVDDKYKLKDDNLKFYAKYFDKTPADAFTYTLNDEKNGYILNSLKADYIGEVEIPDYYNGLPIKKLASGAFENYTKITKVTLNNFISEIPDFAFYNCLKLESVDNLSKIKKIGDMAFKSCVSLKEFDFQEASELYHIGFSSFMDCVSLKEAIFPESLTSIPSSAFKNNLKLEKLDLKNVESIGESAFEKCEALTKVDIPESVKHIKESAFLDCINIEELNLNNNLKTIGGFAFKNTKIKNNYHLPESLENLGEEIFPENKFISELNLPNLKELNFLSFHYFTNLEVINLGEVLAFKKTQIKRDNKNISEYHPDPYLPKLRKITVEHYAADDLGYYYGEPLLELEILKSISTNLERTFFKSVIMKKDIKVNLPNKEIRLRKSSFERIQLADDIERIFDSNFLYPFARDIYLGKNFKHQEEIEKILDVFTTDHRYNDASDFFNIEVSNENPVLKKYKGALYLKKGDYYMLCRMLDKNATTLDLIPGFKQVHKHFIKTFNSSNITKLVINEVIQDGTNNNLDAFKYLENLEEVVLNNNSGYYSKDYQNSNIIKHNDEILLVPAGLKSLSTFTINANQSYENDSFLYNKNIQNFTLSGASSNYEIESNYAVYKKKDGKKELARAFKSGSEFTIHSDVDRILKTAFIGKNSNYDVVNFGDNNSTDLKLGDDSILEFYNVKEFRFVSKDVKFKGVLKNTAESYTVNVFNAKVLNVRFTGNLTRFTGNVKEIGKSVFEDCKKLTTFNFSGVENVMETAFKGSGISKIEGASPDLKVGSEAFSYCLNLKELVVGVNYATNAFNGCENLEKLLVNGSFNFASFKYPKLRRVEIGENAKGYLEIYNDANKIENEVTELVVPKDYRKIENIAKIFPNLKRLTINSSDFSFGKGYGSNPYHNKLPGLEVLNVTENAGFHSNPDDEFQSAFYYFKNATINLHPNNTNHKVENGFVFRKERDGSTRYKDVIGYVGTSSVEELTFPERAEIIRFSNYNQYLKDVKKLIVNNVTTILEIEKLSNLEEVTLKTMYNEHGYYDYLKDIKRINFSKNFYDYRRFGETINKFDAKDIKIEKLTVDSQSSSYKAIDNVIYDSNDLIYYPKFKKDEIFKVPRNITQVGSYRGADFDNQFLKKIYIPKEVVRFERDVFKGCYNLSLYFEKDSMFLGENFTPEDMYKMNPHLLPVYTDQELDY